MILLRLARRVHEQELQVKSIPVVDPDQIHGARPIAATRPGCRDRGRPSNRWLFLRAAVVMMVVVMMVNMARLFAAVLPLGRHLKRSVTFGPALPRGGFLLRCWFASHNNLLLVQ